MRVSGWWMALVSFLIFGFSSTLTLLQIDPIVMYERMGYSETQLAAMRNLPFITSTNVTLYTVACFLPLLIYLLYVKKFFDQPVPARRPGPHHARPVARRI